jgi:hypothetical protein
MLYPLSDRRNAGFWGVSGHCAGIAEAEIEVAATINIAEIRSAGILHENWECACPAHHPVHRHATEQTGFGAFEQGFGTGMLMLEARFFDDEQSL